MASTVVSFARGREKELHGSGEEFLVCTLVVTMVVAMVTGWNPVQCKLMGFGSQGVCEVSSDDAIG